MAYYKSTRASMITYRSTLFCNMWTFEEFVPDSLHHECKSEHDISILLIHSTDCTLTSETTGRNLSRHPLCKKKKQQKKKKPFCVLPEYLSELFDFSGSLKIKKICFHLISRILQKFTF